MRGAARSGGDRSSGLPGGGVRVSQTYICACASCIFDEVESAWHLRRNRHQQDVAARSLPHPLEQWDGRRLDVRGRMNAAFGVGDEWPFEMNSHWARRAGGVAAFCGVDCVRDAFQRAQRRIDGRGYGSCKKVANATGGKIGADAVEGLGRAFHYIVASRAMHVYVKEEIGREAGRRR